MPTVRLYAAILGLQAAQSAHDEATWRGGFGARKTLRRDNPIDIALCKAHQEKNAAMEEAKGIIEAPDDRHRAVAIRVAGERDIARFLVHNLISQGFELQADDNNDEVMEFNKDPELILETLFDVDMCSLNVFHPEHMPDQGWILLVFGNSPPELIADHTINLDKFLVPTWKHIKSFYDPTFEIEEHP